MEQGLALVGWLVMEQILALVGWLGTEQMLALEGWLGMERMLALAPRLPGLCLGWGVSWVPLWRGVVWVLAGH